MAKSKHCFPGKLFTLLYTSRLFSSWRRAATVPVTGGKCVSGEELGARAFRGGVTLPAAVEAFHLPLDLGPCGPRRQQPAQPARRSGAGQKGCAGSSPVMSPFSWARSRVAANSSSDSRPGPLRMRALLIGPRGVGLGDQPAVRGHPPGALPFLNASWRRLVRLWRVASTQVGQVIFRSGVRKSLSS